MLNWRGGFIGPEKPNSKGRPDPPLKCPLVSSALQFSTFEWGGGKGKNTDDTEVIFF